MKPDPAKKDGGQHGGGGRQGEHLEGSLTDGGSLPGARNADEDRSFGAGRREDVDPAGADPAPTNAASGENEGGRRSEERRPPSDPSA